MLISIAKYESARKLAASLLPTLVSNVRATSDPQSRATIDPIWKWLVEVLASLLFFHCVEAALPAADSTLPPFEVEGDLAVTNYHFWEGTVTNHTTQFRALVDHSKVNIKTIGFGTALIEFWEFVTDGTNAHVLEKHAEGSVISNRYDFKTRQFVALKTNREPANKAVLTLLTTPTPTMVGALTPPWLAYGSGSYFQSRSAGEELASSSIFLLVLPQHKTRIKDIASWKWADQNLSFLEQLECQRLDLSVNRNATIADGIRIAAFSVMQWTNAGFATFPMRFELRLFMPSGTARQPGAPKLSRIVVGTANRIVPLAATLSVSPPAQLPYSTWVIDERTGPADRDGAPLTYLAKDGKIMAVDGAKVLAAATALKREQARSTIGPVYRDQRSLVKLIFLILVSGFTLSMAALLWLRKSYLKRKPKPITHRSV